MTKLLDKCVCKNVEKESCKTKMVYNTEVLCNNLECRVRFKLLTSVEPPNDGWLFSNVAKQYENDLQKRYSKNISFFSSESEERKRKGQRHAE